ncbi:DUF3899 domain-containing protein [Saccharibacillus sp. CPCC 101409]|uniref:DUF3899 domain-containing protein n=1 Tax=Saccharibacillus sp. CPCC 101409 TaxID=3058041 RepID=UPI002671C81F|nr:DUF3899 domain-containing protein [Saccharibacillus sp. CPCC 101409]MDO3410507.1 DUF3899 domain-containing protein [Saccharibacillus sp. CPCC 101409]
MNGTNAVEAANQLFLYGLIGLTAGALFHVLQSGFLAVFLRGFSGLGQAFVRQSRFLQRENERLSRDPIHTEWKRSVLRGLKFVFLGGGALLTIVSLALLAAGA